MGRWGKRNRAVKVKLDGFTFDSKLEAARYQQLLLLQKAGKIAELEVHPKYELVAGVKYTPDFEYVKLTQVYNHSSPPKPVYMDKERVVEDVKGGPVTPVFRLKIRLFKHFHGAEVSIWRK